MKKLNKYLLENYPQIWNTRLVWVAAALFIIHLCFYIAGVLYFDTYEKLHGYMGNSIDIVNGSSMSFSILTAALFIIIWLVFYLRNNPFKSFYPLRKTYFFTEFCILFLVFLGVITFYKTYSFAFWNTVQNKTADVNLAEEVNTFNLANAFIPFSSQPFTVRQCCDSLDYKDSLQAIIGKKETDSILRWELNVVVDTFDNANARDRRYSYLNYCHTYDEVYFDSADNQYQISATIRNWLTEGKKDAVLQTLNRLKAMSKRYKIEHNINIPAYADTVFAHNDFSVHTFISDRYGVVEDGIETAVEVTTYAEDDADGSYIPDKYATVETGKYGKVKAYFSYDNLNQTLRAIYLSRTRTFDLVFWLINCCIALSFTVLLFTYRLTSIRTWFIALVGAGVLLIACSLYGIMIHEEVPLYFSYMALIVSFYGMYWFFRRGGRKILSGVNLIWFTCTFPLLFAFTHTYLLKVYHPDSIKQADGTWLTVSNPTYDFLTDYSVFLAVAYFIISFLAVSTLLYRNYRHWQAMPEE